MKSTQQLIARKAWLEAQHTRVCAELRARGVEVDEPAEKAKPQKKAPAKKKTAAKSE